MSLFISEKLTVDALFCRLRETEVRKDIWKEALVVVVSFFVSSFV